MYENDYLPIEEYGIIGDLHTVALVGSNGSIDWLCIPLLDSESVFAALLDSRKGGRFRLSVSSAGRQVSSIQEYEQDTNILVTHWLDAGGNSILRVTDFMPLIGDLNGKGTWTSVGEIHRIVESMADDVKVELEFSPRFGYAREQTEIRALALGFLAQAENGGTPEMRLSPIPEASIIKTGSVKDLIASFIMMKGEKREFVIQWTRNEALGETTHVTHVGKEEMMLSVVTTIDPHRSYKLLEETRHAWRNWSLGGGHLEIYEWAGPWHPFLRRSALVFKLLIAAYSGSVAAAATTSLPEEIGGFRNWDYRYAWIRDAAMITQALASLGHTEDAIRVVSWMEEVSEFNENKLDLQVMYGLRGEENVDEFELDHLEGYRGSSPVRVGNRAAMQFQLEIFGELFNAVYELARRGKKWPESTRRFLSNVANHVLNVWQKPDFGIWEMRTGPFQFTYSKIMAWVALDRAVHLVREYGFPGNADRWDEECGKIRQMVLEKGYDPERGSFVMRFGYPDLDAALLRIPLVEFLPPDDDRVRGTVDIIMSSLMENDLVYRYHVDDGLPGKEGAFGLCTFWLVDALSLTGRLEEANRIYKGMLSRANRLGLFSEEIDVKSGAFLGNFPQAFTHIGVINSALYLSWAEGHPVPEHAPIGTLQHRNTIRRDEKP